MSESKHTPGPWIQDGVTIRAKTPLTSIATVLDVAWPCGNVPYDPKANARRSLPRLSFWNSPKNG